ncbi:MAG TPA: MFS transporter [Capsulimonadaceae bacterium]|nr:MFS transporter [Capsulimonadaceae bacterium]
MDATLASRATEKQTRTQENIVVAAACIGLFLSTLDSGIINIALPTLQSVFRTSVTNAAWTVMLYMMTLSSTIILFGRMSDRYGKVSVMAIGLLLFSIASVLCGISWSILALVLFRGLQGIGAAMLQATAAALITTQVAAERRNSALGTLGTVLGMGPVLGPVIGGLLLSAGGWRWIFWVNLPVCVAGLWLCYRLRTVQEQKKEVQLDPYANILFAGAILALLEGLSGLPHGIRHWQVYVPLACAVLFFVAFVVREVKSPSPIVESKLLRNPTFATAFLATAPLGIAFTVAFIVPPYFLEKVHHLAPWRVGLVLLTAPLGIVLLSKLSGAVMERMGKRRLMIAGSVVMVLPLAVLCVMHANWSAWLIGLLLFVFGTGYGIALPSVLATVMQAVDAESQGTIGAAHRMNQNVGIAIGAAVTAAFIQSHLGRGTEALIAGFRESWVVGAVVVLLCVVGFALGPRDEQKSEGQRT